MSSKLQQAITAIKGGNKEKGKQILVETLKADPNNENAWLWMTKVVDSDKQRLQCLEQVLRINPDNETAKRGIEFFKQRQISKSEREAESIELNSALLPPDRGKAVEKCPECGKTVQPDATFCPFCGHNLEVSSRAKPVKKTEKRKKGLSTLRLILVIFIVALVVPVCCCFGVSNVKNDLPISQPRIETDATGNFAVPGSAYIDGRDLTGDEPATLMTVTAWDGVPRSQGICKFKHGNKVNLVASEYDDQEKRYYYLAVDVGCDGWIAEDFLSSQPYSPVGVQLP